MGELRKRLLILFDVKHLLSIDQTERLANMRKKTKISAVVIKRRAEQIIQGTYKEKKH